MAAILRIPEDASKGVVSFTTQERDRLIKPSPDIQRRLEAIKSRWTLGLHHNWHDFNFEYDPLFDFSMAGEGDLKERSGRPFNLIPLDACNFVPDCFAESGTPFWDVLYVARAVYFKRIPEFLRAIRTLYDQGNRIRVLCICPIPPYDKADEKTAVYNVRDLYDAMFSAEEQSYFTLLTLNFGYPFPFDLPTLAHFYRSSRVCVHFSEDERRSRVAAYGWVSGMPVVAMEAVGSLLPAQLRKPPLFHEAKSFADFPGKIITALNQPVDDDLKDTVRDYLLERKTAPVLRRYIESIAGAADQSRYALRNLAFRLGRHHEIGLGSNVVRQSLAGFVDQVLNGDDESLHNVLSCDDPEAALSNGEADSPMWHPATPAARSFFGRVGDAAARIAGRR